MEALETSFSKIEREIYRLLVRAFFFFFALFGVGELLQRDLYIYTDIERQHHDSFDTIFSQLHENLHILIF